MAVSVILPVAPITAKVLLREYGSVPIKLTNHDILFHQLSYTRVRVESNIQKMQTALTTSIEFVLSEKLASRIKKHVHQIGYHLYQLHKQKMMEFIDAQVKAGMEATASLKNFYSEYLIDDDDFDFETAYRYWKRYKVKKNNVIFKTDSVEDVPCMSNNWRIILDIDQAENAALQFRKISQYLIPNLPSKLPDHIRYYVHYNFSNYTLRELNEILDVPFQTIAYGNQTAKNALEFDHKINEILKYCINHQIAK